MGICDEIFDCQEGCLQPQWIPCPVSTDGEHVWVAPYNLFDGRHSPGHAHCVACGSPDWAWICLEDGCSCKCHDSYYESFLPLMQLLQINMGDSKSG